MPLEPLSFEEGKHNGATFWEQGVCKVAERWVCSFLAPVGREKIPLSPPLRKGETGEAPL